MLSLLIKYRLKYYKNYIRYHFDRRTKIEIGIVVLILLLLMLRSPADIGYNFKWMNDKNFLDNWTMIFLQLLPIFYLISEAFAFITLRVSQEWQILGALPFQRKSIANYFLIRHVIKLSTFLFIGIIPFFLALSSDLSLRIFSFFMALGFLFLLQMLSFFQAYHVRNHTIGAALRIGRWFAVDVLIITLLILFSHHSGAIFLTTNPASILNIPIAWFLSFLLMFHIQRSFVIRDVESISQKDKKSAARSNAANMFNTRNITRATILRDVLFLWREKRSSIVLFIVSIAVSIIVSLAARSFNETVVSLISIEILFSLLWTKTVLILFESDIHAFPFIRSLPISASAQWWTRWLFIAAIISFPLVIPTVVIAIRFGLNFQLLIFSMIMIAATPGLMATLFCNSGFGLFPHINLTGLILMITLILIVLFWFFMPFGSLIILAVIFFWIRKSQRNFKYLELS